MEMHDSSLLAAVEPVSSKLLCLRCQRPEKRVIAADMCRSCYRVFCVWKRNEHPNGTVRQFIEEKPFTGSRQRRKGVTTEGQVCDRCDRPPTEGHYLTRGLCHRCLPGFVSWKKGKSPEEATVAAYIKAKPSRKRKVAEVQAQTSAEASSGHSAPAPVREPTQRVLGNGRAEADDGFQGSLSSTDLSRTISWVKCKACTEKTVLSQDRNLCFPCNGLFLDFEQKEGGETTMERFVEWYKSRHRSVPAVVRLNASSISPEPSSGELIPGFLIGSEEMAYVAKMIRKVAATNASVCIFGETGTGKELVAKAIHELSPRKKKPFIIVDCTSLSEKIAESELFGHARGAFTGAQYQVEGLIAAADTGSIFFDELSVLEPSLQPKLLRVLQERHFRPVGKTAYQEVDMRVIAATNQPLEELVKRRKFREDLYHRLNVFPIRIPPLRERKREILILAHYFLASMGAPAVWFSQKVEEIFQQYSWPGNVRELRNVLERALIMRGEEERPIETEDLPQEMQSPCLSRVA